MEHCFSAKTKAMDMFMKPDEVPFYYTNKSMFLQDRINIWDKYKQLHHDIAILKEMHQVHASTIRELLTENKRLIKLSQELTNFINESLEDFDNKEKFSHTQKIRMFTPKTSNNL